MKFQPKSEKAIQEERCLPAGVYDFEVAKAEDTTSKAGNEMIAMELRVFKPSGGAVFVRDWLLESIAHKLRHLADEVGLIDKYETGELTADDLVGRSGKVRIKIQQSEQYGAQNAVVDYGDTDSKQGDKTPSGASGMAVGGHQHRANVQANSNFDEDDVPF